MSRIITGTVRLDPAPIPVASVHPAGVDARPPRRQRQGGGAAPRRSIRSPPASPPTPTGSSRSSGTSDQRRQVHAAGRHASGLASARGARVAIEVADTGVGIPRRSCRTSSSRSGRGTTVVRRFGGLGLGLAICKQLVELQGGTVEATSPGQGEGLHLHGATAAAVADVAGTDSVSDGRAAAEASATLLRDGVLAGVDILLVDDEADTLMLFKTTLEAHGARVRPAATAAEALGLAAEWRPRLLVSDLGLTGIDGYALLHAIRAKTAHRTLVAVAVTAFARLDDRDRALAAGFQEHIAEPVDPDTLVRTLAAVLAAADPVDDMSASAGGAAMLGT